MVGAEDSELLTDADELEGLAVAERGLDPDAQPLQEIAPAFLAKRVAEREVGLVAHDLEETRMRQHEVQPPVYDVRHLTPPRFREKEDRRR
jgi:hypothetical protein